MANVRQFRRRLSSNPPPLDLSSSDLYIGVRGFKAIRDEIRLRISPLTIISGVNSAGKSSFIQPLLLMKQTLDASFDPGALLLHGANAKFTDRAQALSKGKAKDSRLKEFAVHLEAGGYSRSIVFSDSYGQLNLKSDSFGFENRVIELRSRMSQAELSKLEGQVSSFGAALIEQLQNDTEDGEKVTIGIDVERDRCFLEASIVGRANRRVVARYGFDPFESTTTVWSTVIQDIIHVPGLRGNPEREYPRAAVGRTFPGTFDTYVASVVLEWGESYDNRLHQLSQNMERLGLTWKVVARRKNDATVEVLVGRMPHAQQGGAQDLVSIADVGFGVSQTLPVVVSLLTARAGQIVYIEQPEIHLHPRAQVVLGELIAEAASRGVKVVAETHSSLLIRSLQTEIARGVVQPESVSLNWFGRDSLSGAATLEVAEVDSKGRFGAWPLDFDDVAEGADFAYIEAVRGA